MRVSIVVVLQPSEAVDTGSTEQLFLRSVTGSPASAHFFGNGEFAAAEFREGTTAGGQFPHHDAECVAGAQLSDVVIGYCFCCCCPIPFWLICVWTNRYGE